MNENRGSFALKPVLAALTAAVLLLLIALHVSVLFTSQHGTVRCVLTSLFAILILLRPKPKAKTGKTPGPVLPSIAAGVGVACLVAGLIIPMRQLEWIGLLLVVFGGFAWTLPPILAGNLPWALFVLYWANPLPSEWVGALQMWMQRASVEGS